MMMFWVERILAIIGLCSIVGVGLLYLAGRWVAEDATEGRVRHKQP